MRVPASGGNQKGDWYVIVTQKASPGRAGALGVTTPDFTVAYLTPSQAKQMNVYPVKVMGPFPSSAKAQAARQDAMNAGNQWFDTLRHDTAHAFDNVRHALAAAADAPFNWLTSLGGMIGSGIEVGVTQVLTDIFNVILGPLEVIIGAAIAIIVLSIWFGSSDTGQSLIAAGAKLLPLI